MLARFSIYGFLKNQRYYEPFIILLFLERGFSFTQIGFLVAFREICINIFEVPSGAMADMYGRRRCMMISFTSYIISFALFGFVQTYAHFFAAMFFFCHRRRIPDRHPQGHDIHLASTSEPSE